MHISEFFNIFDLSHPHMEKVNYFVASHDYNNAKKELLRYFVQRKKLQLSRSEEITAMDKNFPLAYISRHFILSGPNEADNYLSSMFLSRTEDYTTMDIMPFIKENMSFMIMSRQKEKEGALFYSPNSIFPPYIALTDSEGEEIKVPPSKYAYISTSSPEDSLSEEDIYSICEESDDPSVPFGSNTGRVYLAFDLKEIDLSKVKLARFCAKITLDDNIEKKELLFFNIADSSWDSSLTWNGVKGNVYSWESSPTGPTWTNPPYSDSEYLNVISRFWFARPMAYQYLSDIEMNSVYGEKLLFLMDAFSQQKEGGFNRVLETGERLSNFTAVLHALVDTPVMTPDYLVSILWMMYKDMAHLFTNPDLGWSNWAVVRTSGLSKAIDFLPELKEHEEWKNAARSTLTELFDKMYSPDFSFREAGLAYAFWCGDLFASAYKSSVLNNDPYNTFMKSRLEKAFDYTVDLLYPNCYDTNIGDSNYCDKTDYLKKMGSLFPTKKLIALTNEKDDLNIPKSSFYPYAGSVIMRNSFKKDTGIYLAMHSMPFDGHAHDDISNLVLYAYGRPLITDNGRYGYSKSKISSHLKSAGAHNVLEIEGENCLSHSASSPKITTFVSNKIFDGVISEAQTYESMESPSVRRVLFLKDKGIVIVSDFAKTALEPKKFNQNWNFMPDNNATADFNNHVRTNFSHGGNIKLVCPDSDLCEIKGSIFSSGYGMAERSEKAVFTKYGQTASMTTLLLPFKEKEPKVSAETISPDNLSVSSMVFDIDSSRFVFCARNTQSGKFSDFAFEGDMALICGSEIYLVNCTRLTHSGKVIIESSQPIEDMYVKISGGIIEIESSSLFPSSKKDEAIRIYSPKTTHVLFNGNSIPFTLYSDYVYAVKAK